MSGKWLHSHSDKNSLTFTSNLISQDFESHMAANLKKELVDIGATSGKSTTHKKPSKKAETPSDTHDAEDAEDFDLTPPVDDGSDDDYIQEDENGPEGICTLPFCEIRNAILAYYKKLLHAWISTSFFRTFTHCSTNLGPYGKELGSCMPWSSLVDGLADSGLSMTGYPQIQFPGEIVNEPAQTK